MSLSLQIVRRHIILYFGPLITIVATTFIVATQVAYASALRDPAMVRVAHLGAEELEAQLKAVSGLLITMSVLAILVSGSIMFSAVKQVVTLRQRELMMMRFVGAGRHQIGLLLFWECAFLSLVCTVPTALFANLLSGTVFDLLAFFGLFSERLEVDVRFDPGLMLIVGMALSLTGAMAGLMAANKITRTDLSSAFLSASRRLTNRQVLWRLVLLGITFTLVALLEPDRVGSAVVMFVPLIVVVPLVAIAPLLIPPVTWLISRFLSIVFPGAGMLTAQRAAGDRWRLSGMAMPIILAVGLLGGFYAANGPDEMMRFKAYQERLKATAVVSSESMLDIDRLLEVPDLEVGSSARLAYVNRSVSGSIRTLYFTDVRAFSGLLSQVVEEGDIYQVRGMGVASSISGSKLGDTYEVVDANGDQARLIVVALVSDSLFEGVFIDWSQLSRFLEPQRILPATVFFGAGADAALLRTIMSSHAIQGSVLDTGSYIAERLERRRANTARSNISLFGTIYVMSLIGLAQTTITDSVGRRRELAMLRSLGIGRIRLAGIAVIESLSLLITAGILIFAALVLLSIRFTQFGLNVPVHIAIASAVQPTGMAFGTMGVILVVLKFLSTLAAVPQELDKPWSAVA